MSKRRKFQAGQGMAYAARWGAGVAGAGQKYLAGASAFVTNSGQSPSQKAAGNINGYLAGVQKAATRWQACCQGVSGQDWLASLQAKGVANYTNSGNNALAKKHFAGFLESFVPAVQGAMQQIGPRGPRGTNLQRWTQYYQWVTGQRGNFKHLWCQGGAGGAAFGGNAYSPANVGGGVLPIG